jgi:hypothetical protein
MRISHFGKYGFPAAGDGPSSPNKSQTIALVEAISYREFQSEAAVLHFRCKVLGKVFKQAVPEILPLSMCEMFAGSRQVETSMSTNGHVTVTTYIHG